MGEIPNLRTGTPIGVPVLHTFEETARLAKVRELKVRAATELDEDGNPIPVRRHHPEAPRRVRSRRFSLER